MIELRTYAEENALQKRRALKKKVLVEGVEVVIEMKPKTQRGWEFLSRKNMGR